MRRVLATLLLGAAALAGCDRDAADAASPNAPAPAASAQATPAAQVARGPDIDTPPPEPAANIITPEGLGPVQIGMTEADALGALGAGWRTAAPIEDTPGSCRHIIRGANEGPYWAISYMLEGGRVVRVEVNLPTGQSDTELAEGGRAAALAIRSERGVGLGATEAEVRRAYGGLVRAEPHTYDDPPAQYLNIWTRGGPTRPGEFVENSDARGIQFVTDASRRVVEIHAGGPAMQYVEGCA